MGMQDEKKRAREADYAPRARKKRRAPERPSCYLQMNFARTRAVSTMRFEKPHSLSYQE